MSSALAHAMGHIWGNRNNAGLSFFAPLTNSLSPVKGSLDFFTRGASTGATITDFEGRGVTVDDDEVRFYGARRVKNLIAISTDFSGPDADSDGIPNDWDGGAPPASSAFERVTDVVDGKTVGVMKMTLTNSTDNIFVCRANIPVVAGRTYTISQWVKTEGYTGSHLCECFGVGTLSAAVPSSVLPATSDWTRVSVTATATGTGNASFRPCRHTGLTTGNGVIYASMPQVEDVTGQTNQSPSEFISVIEGTSENYIGNGTFDADKNGWIDNVGTSTYDAVNKAIIVDNGGGGATKIATAIDTIRDNRLVYYSVDIIANPAARGLQLWFGTTIGALDAGATGTISLVGNHTGVIRLTDDASWFSLRGDGVAGDITVDNVIIKEIDHGSNVDGVKYFDTFNTNYVENNVVKSHASWIGTQIVFDSEFNTDVIGDAFGTDGQWEWTDNVTELGTMEISNGVATQVGNFGAPRRIFYQDANDKPYEAIKQLCDGIIFKCEYKINSGTLNAADPTPITFLDQTTDIFGNVFSETTGVDHVYYVAADASTSDIVAFDLTDGGVDPNLEIEYIRVAIADKIPDATLKGVLIEEASTNMLWYSTAVDQWNGLANATLGTTDSDWRGADGRGLREVIGTVGVSAHQIADTRSDPVSASTAYTASFYVAAGTDTWVYINFAEWEAAYANGTSTSQWFDLANGVVGSQASTGGFTLTDPQIHKVAVVNGQTIYRISVTFTGDANTALIRSKLIGASANAISTSSGDGINANFWTNHCQKEALPWATSIIPTINNSGNRGADHLYYDFPATLEVGDLSYAVTLETFTLTDPDTAYANNRILVNAGDVLLSTDSRIFLYQASAGNNAVSWGCYHATGTVFDSTIPAVLDVFADYKLGFKFDTVANETSVFVDGSQIGPALAQPHNPDFSVAAVNNLSIGSQTEFAHNHSSSSPIKNVKIFNRLVSDTKMQELTS